MKGWTSHGSLILPVVLSLSATVQQLPSPTSPFFTRQYRACFSCSSVGRSYVAHIMFAECLTLQFAGRLIIAAHPCVFVAVSRPLSAPQPGSVGAEDASKIAVCTYCHSVCAATAVAVVGHWACAQHYTLLKIMGVGGRVLIPCCLNSSGH